ncbi:UPF0488 protein CG14286 [Ptiloglossa arizonensis]|uniref:UPF0488 protein CG14286 n=1 Tax=Ptiloglossa arizonensis TaxID=3350558 RepID=UPI003FA05993
MPPKPRTNGKKLTMNIKHAKPPKVMNPSSSNAETKSGLSQEAENLFELELSWCIQQLKMCLDTGKLPEKQARDLNKNINILKSNTVPLVKKRQVMYNTLGNYREKMSLDEQKHGKAASSIKFITPSIQNKKCVFIKKAACNLTKEKQHLDNDPMFFNENTVAINNAQTEFKFNFEVKE